MDAGNVQRWWEGGIGSHLGNRFQCLFVFFLAGGESGDGRPYRRDCSTGGGKDRWWMLKGKKIEFMLVSGKQEKNYLAMIKIPSK